MVRIQVEVNQLKNLLKNLKNLSKQKKITTSTCYVMGDVTFFISLETQHYTIGNRIDASYRTYIPFRYVSGDLEHHRTTNFVFQDFCKIISNLSYGGSLILELQDDDILVEKCVTGFNFV